MEELIDGLRRERDGVVWVPEMLPRTEVVAMLSSATVFVCPSVYEPLGIVNLEAMACELPVVATATGGIPEVVRPRARPGGSFPSTRCRTGPAPPSIRTASSPTSRPPSRMP